MPAFICTACGTQYAPRDAPPAQCIICEEERQYVPPSGQSWITPDRLAARHANTFRQHEEGLIGIGSLPTFAIGQRAIFVITSAGNVLWDCISLIDDATIALIVGLGGLKAIAISHPHFYATMVDWARAFDCPVHLHALDRKWVMRADPALTFWDGDTLTLLPGVTLIRGGGHFPGGTMLHWAQGATLLPASETTIRPREPEPAEEKKPGDELNVDAVFAKLKQIGGGKPSEE